MALDRSLARAEPPGSGHPAEAAAPITGPGGGRAAPPAVSFAYVAKRFPLPGAERPVDALEDVSLEVVEHEIVCLLGPSTSG